MKVVGQAIHSQAPSPAEGQSKWTVLLYPTYEAWAWAWAWVHPRTTDASTMVVCERIISAAYCGTPLV